jgi:ABC-type transport system involved in multi-copper enzyme maturation permease subunit
MSARLAENYIYIAAALICLVTLVIGLRFGDVQRFRFRRVRAIAGVCVSESLRRKVLWITPLAIIGVVAVTQFTKGADEQDAIRQMAKYCLFATSLIVIIAALILSATNLPREIDNRVIYTVVTKPTTRLEIVLGKVLGFALVSALMIGIMGVFTYAYLRFQARSGVNRIQAALQAGQVDPVSRPTLEHYVETGLLGTKALEMPNDLEIFSRPPDPDGTKWMGGGRQQYYAVDFSLTEAETQEIINLLSQGDRLFLSARLKVLRHKPTNDELEDLKIGGFPVEGQEQPHKQSLVMGPSAPSTAPATAPTTLPAEEMYRNVIPQVAFNVLDPKQNPVEAPEFGLAKSISPAPLPEAVTQPPRESVRRFAVELKPDPEMVMLQKLVSQQGGKERFKFFVEVAAVTPSIDFGANAESTRLEVVNPGNGQVMRDFKPINAKGQNRPAEPEFYARQGRVGMQIRGQKVETHDGQTREGSLAAYRFTGADVSGAQLRDGNVGLQLKISVERGGDLDYVESYTSRMAVQVKNRKTGEVSQPVEIEPETSRFNYVYVPEKYVQGGDFDVLVRGRTPGQWLGVLGPEARVPSVAVITANTSFLWNLIKSLFMLWLLAVLVVVIAVFCSTFLSWPIAVVLTVLLLLGRWGVNELGEAMAPGGQRGISGSVFGIRNAAANRAVTDSLEALTGTLRTVSKVLPDVATFPLIEDIDRGVSIPGRKVLGAAQTVLLYGLPLVLLTYVILRNKEVAP